MLTQVDKVEFLILVDNVVEWFSVLPPGFTHELPQSLSRPAPHSCPKDELTKLPMIPFDAGMTCCGAHGLALLIKTTIGDQSYTVLMDGGPDHDSISRNSKAMYIDWSKLDGIVLSHWHRDHSGGIAKALELRNEAYPDLPPLPVDLHPDRPLRRGIAPPPDFIPKVALPADPTFDELTALNGKVELNDEFHEMEGLNDAKKTGVGVSGEIPRVISFEKGLLGAVTWMKDENGKEGWFSDPLIKDERCVVVDVKGQGLVVFSSCSHAGICNVLTYLQTTLNRPIHMVVGGLHLAPTHIQPAKETVQFLANQIKPRPKYVLPLHCTGLEARAMLKEALGDVCVGAGVGMKVVVEGDPSKEEELEKIELKINKL